MKLVKVEDAVGQVLCHDITQIIKDVKKGPIFRKGHVIETEDIPVLLSVGKEHIYVWENDETMLHEDEAAQVLRQVCQGGTIEDAYNSDFSKKTYNNMSADMPKEGKIELRAECDGLFKVNTKALYTVNSFGEMMIATRYGNTPVKKGDRLCGMRIIPLVIKADKLRKIQEKLSTVTNEPIVSVMSFKKKKYAVVTTGSEVYKGRIKDTFTPVLIDKLNAYNAEQIGHTICDDDNEMVTKAINEFIDKGADIVLCSGGMSVDPDDKTPLAIKNTKAEIISYGSPVLPGAMFMLAYKGKTAIMGLPGCVMYAKRTVFDIVLPHIMADNKVTPEYLASLGEGGLILS